MSDWYYAHNNEQKGPTNESEIKAFLATGQLPNTILVWKDGMDAWLPASQVPAFSFRPPPAPAKVQPTAPVTPEVTTTTAAPAKSFSASTATDKPIVDVSDKVQSALNSITSGTGVAGEPEDVEKNRLFASLAYFPVLFIIPLIAAKDSPFAKYHANQGLLLTIAWVAVLFVNVVITIVDTQIMPIIITQLVSVLLTLLLFVGEIGSIVLGIMSAQKGIMKPLPVIGSLAIIIK